MSNYPEDIRNFDSDPRSPFYDDKGEEQWTGNRFEELIDAPNEIYLIDFEELGELVMDNFPIPQHNKFYPDWSDLTKAVEKYVLNKAAIQADKDWENRNDP